jgi:hypothetical protein
MMTIILLVIHLLPVRAMFAGRGLRVKRHVPNISQFNILRSGDYESRRPNIRKNPPSRPPRVIMPS